jgi:hypothetical protein
MMEESEFCTVLYTESEFQSKSRFYNGFFEDSIAPKKEGKNEEQFTIRITAAERRRGEEEGLEVSRAQQHSSAQALHLSH